MNLSLFLFCGLLFGLIQAPSAQVIQQISVQNSSHTLIAYQMNDYGWLVILDSTGLLSFCRMTVQLGPANEVVGCLKFVNINELQNLPMANNIYG